MKYPSNGIMIPPHGSHPVRGAWIEIGRASPRTGPTPSHPVRGAWIEISYAMKKIGQPSSHPVRGAWIEITHSPRIFSGADVAPREGCVD